MLLHVLFILAIITMALLLAYVRQEITLAVLVMADCRVRLGNRRVRSRRARRGTRHLVLRRRANRLSGLNTRGLDAAPSRRQVRRAQHALRMGRNPVLGARFLSATLAQITTELVVLSSQVKELMVELDRLAERLENPPQAVPCRLGRKTLNRGWSQRFLHRMGMPTGQGCRHSRSGRKARANRAARKEQLREQRALVAALNEIPTLRRVRPIETPVRRDEKGRRLVSQTVPTRVGTAPREWTREWVLASRRALLAKKGARRMAHDFWADLAPASLAREPEVVALRSLKRQPVRATTWTRVRVGLNAETGEVLRSRVTIEVRS